MERKQLQGDLQAKNQRVSSLFDQLNELQQKTAEEQAAYEEQVSLFPCSPSLALNLYSAFPKFADKLLSQADVSPDNLYLKTKCKKGTSECVRCLTS